MFLVIKKTIPFILILLLTISVARDIKNEEILTPKASVWDFTYEEESNSPENNPILRYKKIKKEVEKILGLFPRFFKISECLDDEFTNTYCPEALEKADEFWSYKDSSEVITRKDNVEDFTNSIYTIHTGTVRDYVNGEFLPHINTEINYSRGDSKEYTGFVTDYTSKNTSCTSTKPNVNGQYTDEWWNCDSCGIMPISRLQTLIKKAGGTGNKIVKLGCEYNILALGTCKSCSEINCQELVCNGGDCSNKYQVINGVLNDSPQTVQLGINSSYLNIGTNQIAAVQYKSIINGSTSTQYKSGGKPTIYLKASISCSNWVYKSGTKDYPGHYYCADSGSNNIVSCPSNYSTGINDLGFKYCYSCTDICPNNYTETTGTETTKGQCKKLVTYNYYSYGCPAGYVVQNSGFSSWTKTDPNYSAVNYDTLDDAVNSKTPPQNNCIQSLESTAYEYVCGAGYTPFNPGLTTCPAGTSGTCNNKYPPESNCYKDIKYKFYEYGCPKPYKTDNHGLKQCIKTDPDKTRNNESTLNDDCNQSKAPDGNCVAEYEYEYYEYLCEGENSFNEEYTPIDSGLTECIKTDDNITSIDNLGVPCNSITPPKDNCKATEYTCNSEFINPAFVDGEWKCSPFACNIDNKCGYATCNGYSISSAIMPREYNPLLTIIKTGEACQPKSCEPKTFYDDGTATKKEVKICNVGTAIGDKCITNKVNGICPNNFTSNQSGKCEKNLDKSYYYYDYSCKDNTWTLTVNNGDPGCIDDTFGNCLNFDKQTAICKKDTHVCPTTGTECILNEDNEYKCETECNAEFVDKEPCYDEICDATLNDQISYCGTANCPSQFGVFKENNKCYIEICPEGTVETIEGDCINE